MFFEGDTVLTENWFAIMPGEQRQGWMRAAQMTAALAEKRGERQKMRLLLQKIIFAIRLFLRRHETAEVADLYRIGTIAVAQAEESNTRPKRKRTGGGRSFPKYRRSLLRRFRGSRARPRATGRRGTRSPCLPGNGARRGPSCRRAARWFQAGCGFRYPRQHLKAKGR